MLELEIKNIILAAINILEKYKNSFATNTKIGI